MSSGTTSSISLKGQSPKDALARCYGDRIEKLIGMDGKEATPSAAALNTLQALAGRDLSVSDEPAFKVALAIFVICMLCDSNNP